MLKMNTIFLIAVGTVILEPHMYVFFSKLLLCQILLLHVNQMHVVNSFEAMLPIGAAF